MSRGSEAEGEQPGIDERVVRIFLAEQREAGSSTILIAEETELRSFV